MELVEAVRNGMSLIVSCGKVPLPPAEPTKPQFAHAMLGMFCTMKRLEFACRYKIGTKGGWSHHVGHDADERMAAAAKNRDIHLTSKSRPLEPEDFDKFDFIIGMDYDNSQEIKKAAQHWQDDLQKPLPSNWKDKVILSCT